MNALGVLLSVVYKHDTPDFYSNNAHHRLGWLLVWITCAQTLVAFLHTYTRGTEQSNRLDERAAFIPVSTHAMEEHGRMNALAYAPEYRFSDDSGQGTERNTESLKSQSSSSLNLDNDQVSTMDADNNAELESVEKRRLLSNNALKKFSLRKLRSLLSSRTMRISHFLYEAVNRLILILGFIALTTGIVTYGGIFVSHPLKWR
jgi:hypothetical protein